MELRRRTFLAATGGSIAMAGCLGDDASSGDGGGGTATVNVSDHDEFGDILVDADGMTLYLFDSDEQGSEESTCYDGCANAWPPLTASDDPTADDGVTAELSTFERDDGSMQVAAAGWPLYSFASDESPGDTEGQGVNDVWWVVGPDGTKITEAASDGPGGLY